MFGLNAVAFVFFIGLNLLGYRLCKCPEALRRKIMRVICIALLLGNIVRYALIYPLVEGVIRVPVEFSQAAYFSVPAILLLGRKKAKSWAAYSGLMAGFFYYIAMIVAGGPLYNSYPPYDIYIAMFCHGALYICGLVTVGTEACNSKDSVKLVLGVVLVAGRALLLRPVVEGSERLLIYILLDGICVKQLLPQSSWSITLPIYYAAIIALVLLSIKGFFRHNQKQYQKFHILRAFDA